MVGKEEQKEKELQRAVDVSVDALFKLKKTQKTIFFWKKNLEKKIQTTVYKKNIRVTIILDITSPSDVMFV